MKFEQHWRRPKIIRTFHRRNGPVIIVVVSIMLFADPCRYSSKASQLTPAFGESAKVLKVLANDYVRAVQVWQHMNGFRNCLKHAGVVEA